MAKRTKKKTRASLRKVLASSRGSFSPAYKASVDSLVYGSGKNYSAGPGKTYANVNAGAAAADGAGYGFIYLNDNLYTTATGRATLADASDISGKTLDLTTSDTRV